jgi:hypothetical protein
VQLNKAAIQKSVIHVSALGDVFMSALASKLSMHEVWQPFFEGVLLRIHPVIPICHVPTLRQEYSEFGTNLSPSTSMESLVQILAKLYTGAANSTLAWDITLSSSINSLYDEFFRIVDLSPYQITSSSSAIQLLQGFVILNTFRVSPFSAFEFLPRAIQFAQSLRLHVNQRTGNPTEVEVRRRLWWHLLFLDVESTIASGLQGIICPDGYTTQLPSVICGHAISEHDEVPPLAGMSQDISPMIVAMQGHRQWAQRMQIWFERMPDQDEVIHFSRLIGNLLELIGDGKKDD